MKILITNRQRHRSLDREIIRKTAHNILSYLLPSSASKHELSILFVGDRKMKELNSAYRGIQKSTDVLSFEAGIPVSAADTGTVLGDIVISIPKTEAQAREYGSAFYEELTRLLIHGTLHLLGYDHVNSKSDAQKMRRKERETLHAVTKMDQER